jgi:hypothetical protein
MADYFIFLTTLYDIIYAFSRTTKVLLVLLILKGNKIKWMNLHTYFYVWMEKSMKLWSLLMSVSSMFISLGHAILNLPFKIKPRWVDCPIVYTWHGTIIRNHASGFRVVIWSKITTKESWTPNVCMEIEFITW